MKNTLLAGLVKSFHMSLCGLSQEQMMEFN